MEEGWCGGVSVVVVHQKHKPTLCCQGARAIEKFRKDEEKKKDAARATERRTHGGDGGYGASDKLRSQARERERERSRISA